MNHPTEKDEIAFMENEAFLDQAILEIQKNMAESYAMQLKIENAIKRMQITLGELLAHKLLFSTLKKESQNVK